MQYNWTKSWWYLILFCFIAFASWFYCLFTSHKNLAFLSWLRPGIVLMFNVSITTCCSQNDMQVCFWKGRQYCRPRSNTTECGDWSGSTLFTYRNISLKIKWATSWENQFMPYVNNKGADQPAHPHSLISTFVVPCLDSIIPILAKSKVSRF